MNMLKLLPLELKRLLQSRFTWLVIALTAFSPVLGLVLYKPASATTMLSIYLANPAITGGAAGGILFGVLTICEWDRAARHRVEVLMDAVVSPLSLALVRLSALMVCGSAPTASTEAETKTAEMTKSQNLGWQFYHKRVIIGCDAIVAPNLSARVPAFRKQKIQDAVRGCRRQGRKPVPNAIEFLSGGYTK